MKKKYIVANEAFYDDEKCIFGVYIGLSDKDKTLICTAWGNSEYQSKERARRLGDLLNSLHDQTIKQTEKSTS